MISNFVTAAVRTSKCSSSKATKVMRRIHDTVNQEGRDLKDLMIQGDNLSKHYTIDTAILLV